MLISGYSDVSITPSGGQNDLAWGLKFGAYFKLDTDIRVLFPFINACVVNARYSDRPLHVRFRHRQVRCTLYPFEGMAAPFDGRDEVWVFIEELVAFLNDLYERRHALTPNHRLHRKPASIVDIVKVLPRSNCRRCGYATCMAFAVALRKGVTTPGHCPDFVKPVAVRTIYPVLAADGTVESTISIETEIPAPLAEPNNRPVPAMVHPPPRSAAKPLLPLHDRYGIRIRTDLTAREIEVLRLLVEGASNPEISEMLNISPHTVKSHVIHIFNKINANDRTQAAVWAVRNRLA